MTQGLRILRGEARDALVFTGSNFLNRLGGLLLLPLYWNRLTPEDYGLLALIAVIGTFQGIASILSLDLAVTRFYYEWSDIDKRRNLGAIWAWSWIATCAVGAAMEFFAVPIAPALFAGSSYWLPLGILANCLANLFVIPASVVRIKRLPLLFASLNLVGFATSTAFGLWLVLAEDLGLMGFLLSMIISSAIVAILGGVVMLRYAKPALSSPALREAVAFSMRALPAQTISSMSAIVDRVVLSMFSNLQTLGIYALGLRFADVITTLHNSMKMAFGPFLMKNVVSEGPRGRDLVAVMTPWYLIPYALLAAAIALYIDPFVRAIGRPEYAQVADVVPWLVGVTTLGSLYFYYCNGMFLAKKTEQLWLPALAQLLTIVVASTLLIQSFQLAGLVASRYVAAFAFLALSFYLSERAFPMDHRWRPAVALAAVAIGFVFVGTSIRMESLILEVAARSACLIGLVIAAFIIVWRNASPTVLGRASGGEVSDVASASTYDPARPLAHELD